MKTVIKLLLMLCIVLSSMPSYAQDIRFYSISDTKQKNAIESNMTQLLNALHTAGKGNAIPQLESIDMTSECRKRLLALWERFPFVCDDMTNVYPCLMDADGYQVRGIPVVLVAKDGAQDGSMYRELTVCLNKNGGITDVVFALDEVNVTGVMPNVAGVAETTVRRTILKFIEDLRGYYYVKDIDAITAIFHNDSSSLNMRQYLSDLKKCFEGSKEIEVEFDKIEVDKHPTRYGIYYVGLHQKLNCGSCSIEGQMSMMLEVSMQQELTVRLAIWKSDVVGEEEVFYLEDFRITTPDQQRMASLTVKVTPSDAVVQIDGEVTSGGTIVLPVGMHKYSVMAKGYSSEKGSIELSENSPAKLVIELERVHE